MIGLFWVESERFQQSNFMKQDIMILLRSEVHINPRVWVNKTCSKSILKKNISYVPGCPQILKYYAANNNLELLTPLPSLL